MMRRDGAIWFALLALAGVALFALGDGRLARRVATGGDRGRPRRRDAAPRQTSRRRWRNCSRARRRESPRRSRRPIAIRATPPSWAAGLPRRSPRSRPRLWRSSPQGRATFCPPAVRVTTGSKDSFLFADEIDNPANLMSGATDLAFVVVFVYPLVVLAMAFNLLAGEREQGTLAMTLASARRPSAALAGKLTARVAAPIAVTLLAVAAGVWIFAGWERLASPGFAVLLVVVLLYGLFWAALAAAVDGLGRSSAFNALTLIGAWVAITMILPAAINSLAAFAHPAPSRTDMVLAARAASIDADRARDASLARYAEEHGDAEKPAGGPQEATLRRLATQEAAFQRVEAIVAEHDAQLARQRDMADRLGYLSPAYLTYSAMADIAGSGETRYRAFLDRIRAFHVDWREFFLSRAKAGASLTAQDYAAMPKFTQADEELVGRAPAGLAGPLIGVALPMLILGYFCLPRLPPLQGSDGSGRRFFASALHLHEKFWDAPNAFDPDRFAREKAKARHRALTCRSAPARAFASAWASPCWK